MLNRDNLLIVTNNDKVVNKYSSSYNVEYVDKEGIYEVLIRVRDLIHNGYKLLTHPMSGSLKSNQTPYKSILIKNLLFNMGYIQTAITRRFIRI